MTTDPASGRGPSSPFPTEDGRLPRAPLCPECGVPAPHLSSCSHNVPSRLSPRETFFAWYDNLPWLEQAAHAMPLDVLHGSGEAQDAWVIDKWRCEYALTQEGST